LAIVCVFDIQNHLRLIRFDGGRFDMGWEKWVIPLVADAGHLPTENRPSRLINLPRVAFAAHLR
jgi:hypothetical protein